MRYLTVTSKPAFLQIPMLVLMLATIIAGNAAAQHCPYDMAMIIILDIRAADDGPIIPGLRVTMLDSTGAPIMGDRGPVQFWRNPERTTQTGYIDNENPLEGEKIRFWFADDRYVILPIYYNQPPPYSVLIEDIDRTSNGGYFGTGIVELRDEDWHRLCTSYTHWDSAELDDQKVRAFFTPVRVRLTTGGHLRRLD